MRGVGSGAITESPTASNEVAAALVELASRAALESRTHARLILDADPSSDGYLRRFAVVRKIPAPDGGFRWVREGGNRYLPNRQFAYLDFWTGVRSMQFDFSSGESVGGAEAGIECLYFEFGPHGGSIAPDGEPLLRMVFIPGIMQTNGNGRELSVPEAQSFNRTGLILRRWGGVLRVDGPEEIQPT